MRPLTPPTRRALLATLLFGVLALMVLQAPAPAAAAGLLVLLGLAWLAHGPLVRLRRSEEQVAGLFHNSPVPAAVTRLEDGTIVDANAAFLEMIGRTRAQAIGRTTVELGFWESAQRRQAGLQEIRRHGRVRDLEAPFRRASGELAYGIFHIEVIELEGERRIVLTVQDISERRRAQERLRKSEELLSVTGRMARLGGWEVDLRTRTLTWSREVYRIHDLDPLVRPTVEDALGFYAPEGRPEIESMIRRSMETGEPFDLRQALITATGRRIWVRAMGEAEFAEGKPVRLFGVIQDLTEEHEAQERLALLSERLLLATRAAEAGIWDLDLRRRELVWDEGMYRLYGLRPDDYPDPRMGWERVIHPEDRERAQRAREAAKSGAPYEVEFRIVRPDGQLRYVKSYAHGQRGPDGAMVRLTGINLDITARRHTEQTIQRIVKATSSAVGEPFFRSLVKELAAALDTRFASVCELVSPDAMRTVALYSDGEIRENFAYDLAGTPCAKTIANGIEFVPRDVQALYPDDRPLAEMGAQSYLGIALHRASGEPLGLLAILHDRPLPASDFARDLLSIVAARAGAELERLQMEADLKAGEERMRRLVESTHVVPWAFDPAQGRFSYVGPQIEKIVGHTAEHWCTPGFWAAHVHPDDRAAALDALRGRPEDHAVEIRFQALDARWVWLRAMIGGVPEHAASDALQGFLMDVTAQRHAAEELRLAAEVFQSSGEAIVISDAQLRIVTVNPAFTAITGYTPQEAEGRTPYELSRGVRSPEHDREILNEVQRCGYWQGEVWDRRKSGDSYPKWLTLSALRDTNGRIANYIEIFSDVSERKEREERVRHLAHHDALTGLPNRVLLTDRITQALALAQRNETRAAVMFLDLDRFKNVNDSLGHSAGDKLLQEVATRLKAAMRASDTVSRLGGDEFVILMPDVADQAAIAVAARKVLEAIGRPYHVDGHELTSTPSLGIAVYPADGQDVETLLRNADAAMYHAKESGRNNYQFFTQDMNARALERLSLERSLRRALQRDELRLHYQPQYDLRTGRIVGVEALIRWEHPVEGLVSPARFMPFAEETGLILPIGAWVLQKACCQNRDWQREGLPAVRMSVNISAVQFRQAGFAETVRQALADSGLDARYLELEVTESVIMHDADRVTATLGELKQMGLELAIDDFGTGYSSLNYLKRFPIDRLKIDQSFVRDIPSDGEDAAIISAIIGLTRNLGLRTIAEGVETHEQLEFLRGQGCDEVQGYLLSRPLAPGACAQLLREGGAAPVLRAA